MLNNNTNTNNSTSDNGNIRSLERDSGISDHGLEDENENYDGSNDDYDDIDCQPFENKSGLSQDLRFLSGMPELCDVMFIVGEERQPMYGVKGILAIRSRVFYKMLYGPRGGSKSKFTNENNVLSTGATSATTVSQFGRRLLNRVGATGNEDQRRNFAFLKHPQTSLRAAASFSSSSWQASNTASQKTVVQVEEFDADVFKQLLEYVHTGSVVLRPRTLLGLLNAADHFALEELRRACADYSQKCINLDTVCSLLVTAERYIQYKSSKIFVQRVLDFVDKNGDDVLQLTDFVHLPRHVVELILSRDELNASEMNKFQSALRWSRHYILYHPNDTTLARTIAPFTQYVAFHSMSAHQLMHEIRPLDLVADRILMNALAYQADPTSINGDEFMTRFNAGSACRRKFVDGLNEKIDEQQRIEKISKNNLLLKSKIKSIQNQTTNVNQNRSRSVDRNLSKSSNRSSNCSDSGFHDDYYSSYSNSSPLDTNQRSTMINIDSIAGGKRKNVYNRKRQQRQMPNGATVVHVESPADGDCTTNNDEGKNENYILKSINEIHEQTQINIRAKSCQDLTLVSNVSSVHYRF